MRTVTCITVAMVVSLLMASAMAQKVDQVEVKQITRKYDLGLSKRPFQSFLDLSRFHMSQSYSLGFFSGSGQSGALGMYTNTISYQLANPLTLTLNMGILHDASVLWGDKKSGTSARFLPSGWLDWRPSENFRMSIGFETIPVFYNYGPFGAGRSGYWYR